MNKTRKLLCILAHPDDESLGTGGILAKYAAEGVETYLITATRGERGWFGAADQNPGTDALGQIREQELQAAAKCLGIRVNVLLDYMDSDLEQADSRKAIGELVCHIRRIRPDVVVTFDPFGAYGHPDHIAISQLTTAALIAAASADYIDTDQQPPHQVQKLYYLAPTEEEMAQYQQIFGDLVIRIRGDERRTRGWENWAITTQIDTSDHWQQVWQAISCHQTQLPNYRAMRQLEPEQYQRLFGYQTFYLAYTLGDHAMDQIEADLFDGIN